MNQDELQGNWKQLRGQLREWWGQLTDDDLEQIAGKRDKLVGVLQQRYGYSRERAEQEVNKHFTDYDRQF